MHLTFAPIAVSQPVLQLENITQQFPRAATPAVNHLSLTLHSGELLALLGSSGCGKTTLLRLIAGFDRPQTGTIALAGQVIADDQRSLPPEKRDIGMVFQDYALFPHLTVANNVAFGLRQTQRSRPSAQRIQQLVRESLDLVGLAGLQQRYPHELSGGQQQRIALARALAPQPAIVLLDEPLSNLDVQVRLRLRQEVREILKTTETSGIFVTHDQEEALSIADRVAVMHQGQLEQCNTPEIIYQQPATRFVAEFVAQANFLPAQFNGQLWQTAIGDFNAKVIDQTSSSTAYELMVRQEDLQLEPDVNGDFVVHDRQFLGREHRYQLVNATGQRLYARLVPKTLLPVGTRVKVSAKECDRLYSSPSSYSTTNTVE